MALIAFGLVLARPGGYTSLYLFKVVGLSSLKRFAVQIPSKKASDCLKKAINSKSCFWPLHEVLQQNEKKTRIEPLTVWRHCDASTGCRRRHSAAGRHATATTSVGVVAAAAGLEPLPGFAGGLRNGSRAARCCRKAWKKIAWVLI